VAAIDELTWVTFATDSDTPPEMSTYGGRIVGVPPGTPLPTDGTGTLFGVPGYARAAPGGWQWVIQPAQDPLLRFINRIPGAAGWNSQDSRNTWRRVFRRLRESGVPGQDLQAMASDLYAAAVTNHTTPPPA
jgi:hypothetical protein